MTGVRTDDKGVDKQDQKKSNFEPGYALKSKITILAEGTRGSLTKQLVNKFDLQKGLNPQIYGVGVKELWEVPSGAIKKGEVIFALGWPLTTKEYGGGWMYGSKDNLVSLGYVTSLEYIDPRLDPQRVLQECKMHPLIARHACAAENDSLRRQDVSLRRMVFHAAPGRRWLDDRR